MKIARSEFTILEQICELVPAHLVTHLAHEYGAEDKCGKGIGAVPGKLIAGKDVRS
jgi:hypothetical protein